MVSKSYRREPLNPGPTPGRGPSSDGDGPKTTRWDRIAIALFAAVLVIAVADYIGRRASDARQHPKPTATVFRPVMATAVPTALPAPTAVPPVAPTAKATASPTPKGPGFSRTQPLAQGALVAAPNWQVQVREMVRGEEAWRRVQQANQFNKPAPAGEEYLLLRVYVRCLYTDRDQDHEFSSYDLHVTGDRCVLYNHPAVVEPEPRLDLHLFANGEAEGWTVFSVREGEGNLVLVVDERANRSGTGARYVALDPGARLQVPAELAKLAPDAVGLKRESPAPLGTTITARGWQLRVVDVYRGAPAWQMVLEANQFNNPPQKGMEYVAVRVWARNIGTADTAAPLYDYYFRSTGDRGVLRDRPSVVEPEPALDAYLFPNGEHEGWVVVQAEEGEQGLLLTFDPPGDLTGKDRRYLALE